MSYKKIIIPALGMVTILTMGALGMQPSGREKAFSQTLIQEPPSTGDDDGFFIFTTKLIFRKLDPQQTAQYREEADRVLRAYEF